MEFTLFFHKRLCAVAFRIRIRLLSVDLSHSSNAVKRFKTACKRSLGQSNIFTPVYHSVHRGRGSAQLPLDADPPEVGPPGSTDPLIADPLVLGRLLPWMQTPLRLGRPPRLGRPHQLPPPEDLADPPGADPTWVGQAASDTVNKSVVRILLKNILARSKFWKIIFIRACLYVGK